VAFDLGIKESRRFQSEKKGDEEEYSRNKGTS
jgi:hypothetical protein